MHRAEQRPSSSKRRTRALAVAWRSAPHLEAAEVDFSLLSQVDSPK